MKLLSRKLQQIGLGIFRKTNMTISFLMYLNHTMCIWIWTQFNQPYGHVEDRMLRFFCAYFWQDPHYRATQHRAVPCSSLPYSTVQCSTVACSAVPCRAITVSAVIFSTVLTDCVGVTFQPCVQKQRII